MLGPGCQGAQGHGTVISEGGIFQPKDPPQHSKSCFLGTLLSTDPRSWVNLKGALLGPEGLSLFCPWLRGPWERRWATSEAARMTPVRTGGQAAELRMEALTSNSLSLLGLQLGFCFLCGCPWWGPLSRFILSPRWCPARLRGPVCASGFHELPDVMCVHLCICLGRRYIPSVWVSVPHWHLRRP